MIRQLIASIRDKLYPIPYNPPISPGGKRMDKYDVLYLSFPNDTPLPEAIKAYKDKYGIDPTKAIVPVRENANSPFHYDLEELQQGARIEIEPSRSVSVVMLTNYNITWRSQV